MSSDQFRIYSLIAGLADDENSLVMSLNEMGKARIGGKQREWRQEFHFEHVSFTMPVRHLYDNVK